MHRVNTWTALLLAFCCAWWVWAAVRICPSCGYEAAEADTQCMHCGAALPSPAGAAAVSPPPAATESNLPPAAVPRSLRTEAFEQVRMAQQLYEKGALWGSILFARNASAMLSTLGPEESPRILQMDQLIANARARLMSFEAKCPTCDGTGKRRTQAITLGGGVVDQEVAGGRCPLCNGMGVLPATASFDQLVREHAEALRLFGMEERRRGYEDSQQIWLPAGVLTNLSPKEVSNLRKAYGTPCEACMGFRSLACAACGGVGKLKCSNTRCVQGYEICPDCNGRGRGGSNTAGSTRTGSSSSLGSASSMSQRCNGCGGVGKRVCQDCQGKGHLICTKCEGHGNTLCTKCKGTGQSPVCTKCRGEGVVECTRCNGMGKDRRGATCDTCMGRGVLLCKSCLGSGRLARR